MCSLCFFPGNYKKLKFRYIYIYITAAFLLNLQFFFKKRKRSASVLEQNECHTCIRTRNSCEKISQMYIDKNLYLV